MRWEWKKVKSVGFYTDTSHLNGATATVATPVDYFCALVRPEGCNHLVGASPTRAMVGLAR
jgi:hypothetical protein